MKQVNMLATILVVVWGLNWGLYVFDMNLVNMILWGVPMLENAVYIVVAISAVVVLVNLFNQD